MREIEIQEEMREYTVEEEIEREIETIANYEDIKEIARGYTE